MIKSSGYRIGPFEVESALLEHPPAVQESAVVGSPDRIRGLVVKAFIVLNQGFEGSEPLIKELQNHVKRVTAPYKYPRIIEFVDVLPQDHFGQDQTQCAAGRRTETIHRRLISSPVVHCTTIFYYDVHQHML